MLIGGMEPVSLSDYPGRVAAVVFTQGCDFRCPFCHNAGLLSRSPAPDSCIPEKTVLDRLTSRRGRIEGVVVTGGEPTLQADLAHFIEAVRTLGFLVKLDTNGSRPEVLKALLADGLLDFIAMDVKAPPDKYDTLTGVRAPVEAVSESIRIISGSGLPHEFRTTVVPALLTPEDVEAIRRALPAGSPHRTQPFRPEHALDPRLRVTHRGVTLTGAVVAQ